MKNPTALDRDKWAKQNPPSPFPTQLQKYNSHVCPANATPSPPQTFPALFGAYKETTKAPGMGLLLSKLSLPPPPAAHTSLCKLLERLKPQQEHRWPEQAGKMGIRYRQTPWDKPHGKTWPREEPWKAKQARMLPSK